MKTKFRACAAFVLDEIIPLALACVGAIGVFIEIRKTGANVTGSTAGSVLAFVMFAAILGALFSDTPTSKGRDN